MVLEGESEADFATRQHCLKWSMTYYKFGH